MGAIFNAQANHSPLLITAGQQVRPAITMQANLTNRDATRMPHPLVKWSYEPPRAADVPAAIGRAIHTASLPPKGPAFVSIPMDDWSAEADADGAAQAIARSVDGRGRRRPRPRSPTSPGGSPPPQPGARRRPRHRRVGRLGARRRARRASAPAVWAIPADRRRPARLPREPPQLPGRPAAGDRPGLRDARRPRPDPRRRRLGLRLLPLHPRRPAARGRRAGRRSPPIPRRRRGRRWARRSSPTSR